jgi:hypothetical protein
MAEIYRKASRVIVWFGEATGGGGRTLKAICTAADSEPPESSICFNGRGFSEYG